MQRSNRLNRFIVVILTMVAIVLVTVGCAQKANHSKGVYMLVDTSGTYTEELNKAQGLKKVPMTTRETSDLIMMGIGAFTPLDGFMGKQDWQGACDDYKLASKGGMFS